MTREPDWTVYLLKLESLRGEGIHELRALLKRLLRPHRWRCVSVERECALPHPIILHRSEK
jgi:hypothetical protein